MPKKIPDKGSWVPGSSNYWDKAEDMTEVLRNMQEEGPHAEESDDEEES